MSAAEAEPACRLRSRILAEDRPVFGAWLGVPSRELLDGFAASALDYIGIDCQHGTLSENEAARLMTSAGPAAPARLVRVSANRPELIGKVLDGGADGVIVPTVNSAWEARDAVLAGQYPPDGLRSYGVMARYLPRDPSALQSRTLILPMIETVAGLEAVTEILAVSGVDGVYVGPADLGISLGLGHSQFPAGPELESALRSVVDAGRSAGKIVGIHAGSELYAPRYTELGFRLLTLGTHQSFISAGVDSALGVAGAEAGVRDNGPRDRRGDSPY